MPSLNRRLTIEERKANFNRALKNSIELGIPPVHSDGLPTNAFETITKIADKYPETDASLVKQAKRDWAEYMAWRTAMRTRRK